MGTVHPKRAIIQHNYSIIKSIYQEEFTKKSPLKKHFTFSPQNNNFNNNSAFFYKKKSVEKS